MAGPFEIATKAAIEEILREQAKQSKFGYILTAEGLSTAVQDLYDLLLTSRNLKSQGDRVLQQGFAPAPQSGRGKPRN